MNTSYEKFNQLSYRYFFKENDEKSRLFDDIEEDLISKLEVFNIYNFFFLEIIRIFKK
jgi:hypothetical protein